ncbi:TauD/TfdA family dioxygenase [Solimicrobium silvestre]|uniref:Taurine catabolism dioxygenase TauD, TfdA family n=1 Tax=Solimicrobium silvestre TaxID=2099400 RepID=A0A2S9H2Z6_9BURK|nr:TauD/TfdA family dioxygenase [Solimicrobium silvestre]PRC94351.1 Taurine catabolism dioxygenase TauD, TfdA family [Solimicrobium silvestre]
MPSTSRAGSTVSPLIEPSNSREATLDYLLNYINSDRQKFRLELEQSGTLLFRNFQINTVEQFDRFTQTVLSSRVRYRGGDARRTLTTDYVYTSNDTSGEKYISVHNEMGYSRAHPEILIFYCKKADMIGGETLLTDGRKIAERLSPAAALAFALTEVTYIQNLPAQSNGAPEWPKTWAQTFESNNPDEVSRLLDKRGARFWWTPEMSLHIEETLPSVVAGAYTGVNALFCQADRWHASQHDDGTRQEILAINGSDRYHHCIFANGKEMNPDHLRELGKIKKELAIGHQWQSGDVLLIDNSMTLHGRTPYRGLRELFVAMGKF